MTISDIIIRNATIPDVPNVATLFQAVISGLSLYYNKAAIDGEIKRYSHEYIAQELAKNSKAVSLAFRRNKLVGFFVIQDQNGPVWIDWYGVDDEARGEGVGQALIDRLIIESANGGATKLWCATRLNNTPSINLLSNTGFTRLCSVKRHWYGEDFYLWERML